MKKTLSRKQRFFNKINLTTDDEIYVGIDVHKKNCHVAVRLNGALAITFVAPSDNIAIARMMCKPRPAFGLAGDAGLRRGRLAGMVG